MNRKERRKQKKSEKIQKFYSVSDEKNRRNQRKCKKNEGISEAFVLMMGLSVMTISDHIHDLYKVKGYEKCREERFTDYVLKLWEEFHQGIFSLQDVMDCLKDECGLTIELDKVKKFL